MTTYPLFYNVLLRVYAILRHVHLMRLELMEKKTPIEKHRIRKAFFTTHRLLFVGTQFTWIGTQCNSSIRVIWQLSLTCLIHGQHVITKTGGFMCCCWFKGLPHITTQFCHWYDCRSLRIESLNKTLITCENCKQRRWFANLSLNLWWHPHLDVIRQEWFVLIIVW